MKNIFLAVGVVATLLLTSCGEEKVWKQSDIAYTPVYTVTGTSSDVNSLDLYPEKGIAIEYTNSSTILTKYVLNSINDTISADGDAAYIEYCYTMPDTYEYVEETGDTIMLDAIIEHQINGYITYADEVVDYQFEEGDSVEGFLVYMYYKYIDPASGDTVQYDSGFAWGSGIYVTISEKYN